MKFGAYPLPVILHQASSMPVDILAKTPLLLLYSVLSPREFPKHSLTILLFAQE